MGQNVIEELAQHEAAEEEVVCPVLRREVDAGDALPDTPISEEEEAEQVLAELKELGVDHPEFQEKFDALRDGILEHAEAEETEVFPPLRRALDEERLEQMATWVERAEATAPTRPHPNAPNTSPGIYEAGPVATVFDRARDALRSAAS